VRSQPALPPLLTLTGALLTLLAPQLTHAQSSPPAPAHRGGASKLTADDVARRALASSYQVEAQQHELEAAHAGVDQAQAGYYPRLTAAARYTRLSDVDNPALGNLVLAPMAQPGPLDASDRLVAAPLSFPTVLDQYALTAQLQVPISDYFLRVPNATESASANEKSSALQLEAARLQVATDAKKLFYAWMQSKLQLTVAEQTLVQTQAHLADAKKLLDAGMISNADVLSAEAQVAQSELLLERAKNLAALNERRLRTLMHDPGQAPYELGETLPDASAAGAASSTATAVPAGQDGAALERQALDRRLELKALHEADHALSAQADVAHAQTLPRLDGTADVTYANPNPRFFPQRAKFDATWSAGVQLSWTPTDIAGASAQARGARARAAATRSQAQLQSDAIKVEVARALQAQDEAQKAIETTGRRVRSAEEAQRVRTLMFQNGRATGVEVTDAETELTRARLALIESQIGLRVAQVDVAHATGADVGK
jgi:outer membrane protein TolC